VIDAVGDAVVAADAAPVRGGAFVTTRPGIASHDTSKTASNAAKALILSG